MKKLLAIALLLVACPTFAAIQYEFFQKSSSDNSDLPPADVSGRTTIDGDRSRIDFIGGNVYSPGTYLIATNGTRRLLFVDPIHKTYSEINTLGVVTALGSSSITIENLKSSVDKLTDHQIIAGQPTDHYRLQLTYDITVNFRGMPLKQSVRTVIDKWTTLAFGDLVSDALTTTGSVQTGNAQVDELIAVETTKIKGFPLKQSVSITTTNIRNAQVASKVNVPASRTRTREMEVTTIRQLASIDPLTFTVPAAFRKLDVSDKPAETPSKVLTFEPPAK